MKFVIKTFLIITVLTGLISCGADKLKSTATTNRLGLSGDQTCSCIASYSPVCAAGKDYENNCLAQCYGALDIKAGHCDCHTNTLNVCGSDGVDYSECDAIAHNIQITKYIPCAAKEN